MLLWGASAAFGQTAPHVHTSPAHVVQSTNAVLRGFVTPNGLPTRAWFEWGTDPDPGLITETRDTGSGTSVVHVQFPISPIIPEIGYHFRLVASNALGVVRGHVQRFKVTRKVWSAGGEHTGYGQNDTPASFTNGVAIDGGFHHTLGLRADGRVMAWGANYKGQTNVPSNLSNVVTIACGGYYNLALLENGTVRGFGDSTHGGRNPPAGLSNVVEIAASTYHSLARLGSE
jgi:hypothetical protein